MLYDIGFFVFSIFYMPALIFKGKLHKDFGERFGIYSGRKLSELRAAREVIWIQAVSVGEVSLCKSLIPAIRERFPDSSIVFSTITKTGNELARKLFSEYAVIIYFPLDFSFVVKRAVSLIKPTIYIMVETEIWPNLLKTLAAGGVRTILVNGRISDRSFGKYELARPMLGNTLKRIGAFCMQSETDARRIIAMGAPKDKVRVTGTMKFDIDTVSAGSGEGIKTVLGLRAGDELIVAGSTHKGEERALLGAFKRLACDFPGLRLLIAPRHVERAGEIEKLVKSFGFSPVRVSKLSGPYGVAIRSSEPKHAPHVFILDTIGSLNEAFSAATLVFIGGSLIKHGGQNPLEPAAFGKPVLFGPHMFNFRNIVEALLANDAAVQLKEGEDPHDAIVSMLKDRNRMRDLGWNAKRAITANRGATLRNIEAIMGLG
jgi:3-deoxy-D-manno-octulosonic-acid transferase